MTNEIQMTRPNGRSTIGYTGYSWTTLFFGMFPALYRGHISAALAMLIAAFVTSGMSCLVFPFFYNEWHMNWLKKRGFEPASGTLDEHAMLLQ